jgi:hypothetical protein
MLFFFPAKTRAPPPRGPILPRPKHPPATSPARCIELLLHEPGISSLDLSVSDAHTTLERVQKLDLHELPFPEGWVGPVLVTV